MKILVTGASGKTGKAVIQSLSKKGLEIYAMIHRRESDVEMISLGCTRSIVGDLLDESALHQALYGMDVVYLIIPNMTPQESLICEKIIKISKSVGVQRIIYHSVLHPQASLMPHHWQKLLVEEQLFTSSLDFTILQPTAYMQNILGYRKSIETGTYPMPYPISTRISLVDLNDVAEVASKVIAEQGHSNAIYELVGTEPISQIEIAEALTYHSGRSINAVEKNLEEWSSNAIKNNMPTYIRETLYSMFSYYGNFGLCGNSNILKYLLNRNPTSLEQFLKRDYII
jgi:NAD(P)H dehydrogenase (quinone)